MRLIYIFMVLTINCLVAGEIISTNDFGIIEKEASQLDEESLLLFDVDATLIVPKDVILKPKGKYLFKKLIAGHTDRDLFREIRMRAPHGLVDNKSVNFVQSLQCNKIPVIAFTAAPSKIREMEQPGVWRVEELKSFGFDFSPAFPDLHFLELPKKPNQKHAPLFRSGVLYSSLHPKGDILMLFLHELSIKPKKVVFVDDELEQVKSVVKSLDKQGIPSVGIHYTAADDNARDLNHEQAQFQINYFIQEGIWLGDEASMLLIEPK